MFWRLLLGLFTCFMYCLPYSWNCEGDLEYDKKGEAVLSNDNLISFLKELGCRSKKEYEKKMEEFRKKFEHR